MKSVTCPRCGGEVPATASRCGRCAAPVGPTVATGVLTPPPALEPSELSTAFGTDLTSAEATIDLKITRGTPYDPSEAPTAFGTDSEATIDRDVTRATAHDLDDAQTVAAHAVPANPVAAGPLAAGQAFGSRYHIIRALGVGGMGAVYQAWDAELGVTVALKVIRPEVMADPSAAAEVERRFKRELLLARQVTHKSVVRIHDLGEIQGIKYLTMTYVEGSDLSTLMSRGGRLPVEMVMRVARRVVSGLVEAHKAGVVHRDLKPANIMIDQDGHALIMDFGIARSAGGPKASPARPAPPLRLPAGVRQTAVTADETRYGAIVGTLAYMAPEQAKGDDVDQRADIYAFGLILYDMIVGREWRSQHAESGIAELQARMAAPPAPVTSVVPDVPEPLDRLILRCVEPDATKRYQSTEQLAADLDRLDDHGKLIPIKRVVGIRLAAAVALLLLAIAGGAWWYAGTLAPPPVHDPVSVVIADFENNTGDPAFDRALEPTFKRALEESGFINAYDRNTVVRILGARIADKLDETTARELAVKQGLGVVLAGSIDRQGTGYTVSIKATQTVTGVVVANTSSRAAKKDQVLSAASRLVTTVRAALGDDTSESSQIFAMTTLSATSLDVVGQYAAAQEAASNNKFEEAIQHATRAVELDPKFGIGYQILAYSSRNIGKTQDAEKYINEALRYLDGMTERERFSTRGFFYRITGDYQQCVKEYGELVSRFAGDVVGRNQRALCLTQLRDMRGAVEEMRRIVELLPNRVIFRDNLAFYANYATDFETAEKEARTITEPDAYAGLALAFAQLGQGQVREASETYMRLASINGLGRSMSASGRGDLATYEGRFDDAARILEEGAAADLASKSGDRAAAKWAAIGFARLSQQRTAPAIAAAEKALSLSQAAKIRFLAGRVFIEAGELTKARQLSTMLGSELQAEPQAYGKILDGDAALKTEDARDAIKLLLEANTLLDTWIGHFDLGRAYLEARQFTQADSEFDRCLKRRGEALALFLDEEPTFAFFPSVYYYQGRTREGLQSQGFAESYRRYIDIRSGSKEDPLVPEARRRAGL